MSQYETDRKIDQLDSVSGLENPDVFPIVRSGGTYKVTMTQLAAKIAEGVPNPPSLPSFCRVKRSTTHTWTGNPEVIPWEAASGTMTSLFDPLTPTRLTVPSGTTWAKARLLHCGPFVTGARTWNAQIRVNGAVPDGTGIMDHHTPSSGGNWNIIQTETAPLPVVAGDYFEARMSCTLAAARQTISAQYCWFVLELLN